MKKQRKGYLTELGKLANTSTATVDKRVKRLTKVLGITDNDIMPNVFKSSEGIPPVDNVDNLVDTVNNPTGVNG